MPPLNFFMSWPFPKLSNNLKSLWDIVMFSFCNCSNNNAYLFSSMTSVWYQWYYLLYITYILENFCFSIIAVHISITYFWFSLGVIVSNTTSKEVIWDIVMDNIDVSVKTCYMRYGKYGNKSLHYVNTYGVQNRIDLSTLPDFHPIMSR